MTTATVARDRLFRVLGDPSRRAILEALVTGEAAVKDLTARFSISQPAISQHLATLKAAGLVKSRREGRLTFYRLRPGGMQPLLDWVTHYRHFWLDRMGRLERLLEDMDA